MSDEEKSVLDYYSKEELSLITETVARDATDTELKRFLYTARARGLDPLLKQIYCIIREEKRVRKMIVQTSIEGFRLIADRTGSYAPGEENWTLDKNGRPTSATVSARKLVAGKWIKFSCTAHMSEYNVPRDDFWKRMPHTMIAKCAEVKAIKKGWPKESGGLYIPEEMSQAQKEEEKPQQQQQKQAPQRATLPPIPEEVIELPWELMNVIEPLRKYTSVKLRDMKARELEDVMSQMLIFEAKAKTAEGKAWSTAIWNTASVLRQDRDACEHGLRRCQECGHDTVSDLEDAGSALVGAGPMQAIERAAVS